MFNLIKLFRHFSGFISSFFYFVSYNIPVVVKATSTADSKKNLRLKFAHSLPYFRGDGNPSNGERENLKVSQRYPTLRGKSSSRSRSFTSQFSAYLPTKKESSVSSWLVALPRKQPATYSKLFNPMRQDITSSI